MTRTGKKETCVITHVQVLQSNYLTITSRKKTHKMSIMAFYQEQHKNSDISIHFTQIFIAVFQLKNDIDCIFSGI